MWRDVFNKADNLRRELGVMSLRKGPSVYTERLCTEWSQDTSSSKTWGKWVCLCVWMLVGGFKLQMDWWIFSQLVEVEKDMLSQESLPLNIMRFCGEMLVSGNAADKAQSKLWSPHWVLMFWLLGHCWEGSLGREGKTEYVVLFVVCISEDGTGMLLCFTSLLYLVHHCSAELTIPCGHLTVTF